MATESTMRKARGLMSHCVKRALGPSKKVWLVTWSYSAEYQMALRIESMAVHSEIRSCGDVSDGACPEA